ncbi:MAG: signal recognition particle protein Srp19 [Crenarchaeota archaeon]|nr:signal recognition particle protein Srp19 [Thermoproteota archaeon]
MRKQDKAIVWPAYFDLNKTRNEGRRITKNLSISSPKITEIEEAAARLGLDHEVVPEKGYPKTPWTKPGMLLIKKQESKEKTINTLAKQLIKIRNEAPKQDTKK